LYECISPLRALLMQKTKPKKFKKVIKTLFFPSNELTDTDYVLGITFGKEEGHSGLEQLPGSSGRSDEEDIG